MALNDVWHNLNKEIGVYWKGRFDRAPGSPGTYAWFYPLRINTLKLEDFVAEVNAILCFDAKVGDVPRAQWLTPFAWEHIHINVERRPKRFALSPTLRGSWDRIASDEALFSHMRRCVMRASLFMPPLYVGKTVNLNLRCRQHVEGTGNNDFHRRYETFATKTGVQAKRVRDLLFGCIRTTDGTAENEVLTESMENIIEEILKSACKPPYSTR